MERGVRCGSACLLPFAKDSTWHNREGGTIVSQTFLLRQRLVDGLKRANALRNVAVEEAMRAVPRHVFAPNAAIEVAYEDRVIGLKEEGGVPLSTISQPTMIAEMLQQLGIVPGQRMLEIGTGSGYTTALLAHLTGPAGSIVSLDLEPDLVRDANARFDRLKIQNIYAIAGDGAAGYAKGAPFDRILLTASANDIEAAWWEQLRPHGRIVLPLSFNGIQKSVAFDERGGALFSRSMVDCAFIPLRTPEAVAHGRREYWSGLAQPEAVVQPVPGSYSRTDLPCGLALWIALADTRACLMHSPADDVGIIGLCDRDTVAVLRWHHGLVVNRHGPDERIATDLNGLVLQWVGAGRPGRSLDIVALRSGTTAGAPPDATFVVHRPHTTFFLRLKP